MPRGTTLVELLLALAVAGLLVGLAMPRVRALLDRAAVDQAAQWISGGHRWARILAVTRSQSVVLTVTPDSLTIHPAGATTPLWRSPGPSAVGVTLAGPGRQTVVSPAGLALGVANATYRLTRGAAARVVVVSRLGRIRTP